MPIFTNLIEIHATNHCNISCGNCSHFAPGSKAWYLETRGFGKALELLKNKISPQVIHLMGGEPLLNINLSGLLYIIREKFPNVTLKLITNGILLSRIGTELVDALKQTQAIIAVSKYPQIKIYKKIEDFIQLNNLNFEIWEQENFIDFFNPKGDSDRIKAYSNCLLKGCVQYRDEKIFICSVSAWLVNQIHGLTFEDGIDIHLSEESIDNFIKSNIPLTCKYCREKPERVRHYILGKV